MKPPSGPKKQTQSCQACVVCEGVAGLIKPNPSGLRCLLRSCRTDQRPKSLAKKSGHNLYKLLCRYSLDGKHCDGIIAEVY